MTEASALSKVLYIDLTNRRYWIKERGDIFKECLGGTGVAIRLLQEECKAGTDPLAPENPIIFCAGYLNGVFPLASKTVAMFKSPLTKNLGESHAGGRCGVAMRMAGLGGIVIRGKSESPVYLVVNEYGVRFKDASALWGMSSSSTVGRIIRERETGAGVRAIMRIGRAGENLVSYAGVITETFRHFGRLGLGAVFGSKKLKAIVISGRGSLILKDARGYRVLYDELYRNFTKTTLMKKYHELGTPMNVIPLNVAKSLPSRNLQRATFEGAEALSGEAMSERFLGRRAACAHCPVSCIHIAALRVPYESEPHFYKTKMISYDYEPIYALGSMLEIRSPEGFLQLMDRVEELGLDAISTGVVLAWATECMERGIVGPEETGGLVLKWGDYRTYIEAAERIAGLKGGFYEALGKGLDYASSMYGGEEFALAFGGNEMPGYHCGLATHLGFLVGARHSHLDNAGYAIDQKLNAEGRKAEPTEIAKMIFEEECWRQVLSSLVVCFFARGVYTPEVVSKCLSVIGINFTPADLKGLGESILRDKYEFKFREGFSFDKLRIPKRVTEIPTPQGPVTEKDLREGIKSFEGLLKGLKSIENR
ncbi:MAG: aldehyde ferredoxin oxidoreductase family protein [Candidatus Methanomethyliaceae archaeon]|nr:aldehyde ferredoxin oxidoreductase family protein [Candidatus Methanomethyliaceae archaeon]